MRKLLITLVFLAVMAPQSSQAECPKNKKEWTALGPKFLIETAARRSSKVEIPDFSAKLGKDAKGIATPFKQTTNELVLVEAKMNDESLLLSGIMRCDLATKQPVLLSLTWVKGKESGLVKLSN